jgi:hypothetical protein
MSRDFSLAFFFFSLVACSPAPDYSQAVQEFQGHKNAGNVELALNMFADEPNLQFGPLGTISGLNEIRGILEYDLALNTQLRLERCEAAAFEVTCRVTETNDWLRLVDIESITYAENKFIFATDGRIESISATLSAESGQLLGAAMAQFDAWAKINCPIEYADLFSEDGAFVYSRENGEKVLALLRQWRKE